MVKTSSQLNVSFSDPLKQAYILLGKTAQRMEDSLAEAFQSSVNLIPEVSRHLIGSGGKRIRPLMLMLIANTSEVQDKRGLNLAVAVELVHNASLLHDDVVDCGEWRHNVLSAPHVYGNSASVLVGDFLLGQAMKLVVEHGDTKLLNEFIRILGAMAEGEIMQLARSGRLTISQADYADVIAKKTAGLFSLSCRAGASLAGLSALEQTAAQFGRAFGMAFQLTDDILDYTAPMEQSGKDVANDLRKGKTTLPLLLACEQDPTLLNLVEATFSYPEPSDDDCQNIVKQVLASSAIPKAIDSVHRYVSQAHKELQSFSQGKARDILSDLTDFILARVEIS